MSELGAIEDLEQQSSLRIRPAPEEEHIPSCRATSISCLRYRARGTSLGKGQHIRFTVVSQLGATRGSLLQIRIHGCGRWAAPSTCQDAVRQGQ